MALLECQGITVRFGGHLALDQVDVAADAGFVTGLIDNGQHPVAVGHDCDAFGGAAPRVAPRQDRRTLARSHEQLRQVRHGWRLAAATHP